MCLGWAIRVRALLVMQAALLVMHALERGTFLPQMSATVGQSPDTPGICDLVGGRRCAPYGALRLSGPTSPALVKVT